MHIQQPICYRAILVMALIVTLAMASTRLRADTGTCGGASITLPFTDVPASNIFFCAIAAAYFSGLTNGTSATTYSPQANVPREQMAAFVSRTLDQSLKRGSKRAVAQQWWQPTIPAALRSTDLDLGASTPTAIAWDGADLWVATFEGTVARVRASDGKRLETWTGAASASDIIVAAGRVYVTGVSNPGRVYVIDPTQAPGPVTLFADSTGGGPGGITFTGTHLWTANGLSSITRIQLSGFETTFTSVFMHPIDILWDGENLWVADQDANRIWRVDPATGSVLDSIPVGNSPFNLLFDGSNLWVCNRGDDSVTVIRAVGGLRGARLAFLTGNGLDGPTGLAFDGERVLVVNNFGDSVSLFKAADFTPLGNVGVGSGTLPQAACSDGLNFWITRIGPDDIVRF